MSKTFIASFVGRLAAALFIAICVFLGFGPKEWAAFVISGWQWVTPAVAQWAFLGLGALASAWINARTARPSNASPTAAMADIV